VSGDTVVLSLTDRARTADALRTVETLPGAGAPTAEGSEVIVRVPHGGAALPGLLRDLDALGVDLDAVEVRRPTLDDVFLSLTGRSLREQAA
jgi:ABC-2 type transport system ATP-binding protein